jgi:hypothetical protein
MLSPDSASTRERVRAGARPPAKQAAAPQPSVACPYCQRPMTTRPDGSFSCGRCGEFPNYGRLHTTPSR